MTYRNPFAHCDSESVGYMDDRPVLDVGLRTDPDGVDVAPEDGPRPDTGLRSQCDIAHDRGPGMDKGGGVNLRKAVKMLGQAFGDSHDGNLHNDRSEASRAADGKPEFSLGLGAVAFIHHPMSSPEPFAPRQFTPDEVMVSPPARESFLQLKKLGGLTLWLCAGFSLGHSAIIWERNAPLTWLTATGALTVAIWQPVLGTVLLLQDLGEVITKKRQRWLSLMTWAVFGWGLMLLALAAAVAFGTAQVYQKQTEDHGVETNLRSENFRQLRTLLNDASSPAEMRRMVELRGVEIPADETLPEAPRPLREKLKALIDDHEVALDARNQAKLDSVHADLLFSALARFFGALAAATMAFAVWARSGWIRLMAE